MSANTYLTPTKVIPGALLITNITKAPQAVVTFTNSDLNTYIVGQCVYFEVNPSYGMFQIDGKVGKITFINSNNFTIDIDSSLYDTFAVPVLPKGKPASFSPAGSRNLSYSNDTRRVAFQNLSNTGN